MNPGDPAEFYIHLGAVARTKVFSLKQCEEICEEWGADNPLIECLNESVYENLRSFFGRNMLVVGLSERGNRIVKVKTVAQVQEQRFGLFGAN